ncbi:MAG: YnbE family lipoprotein [Sphingopyxis sp.]
MTMRGRWGRLTAVATLCVSGSLVAGCVQVNAPDHPIEITLNINIRQEVVYRLDSTAKELIEQNVEIF